MYRLSLCVPGSKNWFLLGLVEFHRYLPHWGFLHDFAVLLRLFARKQRLGQGNILTVLHISMHTRAYNDWLSETRTRISPTWVLLFIFPLQQFKTSPCDYSTILYTSGSQTFQAVTPTIFVRVDSTDELCENSGSKSSQRLAARGVVRF